ncbi:MAG: apolipoprotein N-acyltransferase [Planctomycetota bacterium]|nr:apolipoprotein N-acyltransferase [Planctomycetota bacterium]
MTTTARLAFAGALLMWLSFPPVDFGWLAWLAPICWLIIIRREQLSGKRPYLTLYFAGVLFWGAVFVWICKPHWSAAIGWVAMSFGYTAFYTVVFVAVSRVAVHRWRIPLVIAAPTVWTGLELARAYLLDGFLMGALGHTQYRWITLIQISDLVGAYGVTFLVMFVAACLASCLPVGKEKFRWWPAVLGVMALAGALVYGHFRTSDNVTEPGPQIALIQGSVDTNFDVDPLKHRRAIQQHYTELTIESLGIAPDVDLVIWPETMYVIQPEAEYFTPFFLIEEGAYLPAKELAEWTDVSAELARRYEREKHLPGGIYEVAERGRADFRRSVRSFSKAARDRGRNKPGGPPMLIGVDCEHFFPGEMRRYNTSVYLDGNGEVQDYYHKTHPVIFGEYMPLGDVFPWLYQLTPLYGGLASGDEAKSYNVAGFKLSPSICYETVLPQVIRRQFVRLCDAGDEPDILVTQTNDGWFWGSAELDMHLICGVFRSVECRKPLLIAANTGFSAWIDADGNILKRGPRRDQRVIVAKPAIDSRDSLYMEFGDWFAYGCAAFCVSLVGLVVIGRYSTKRR